MTSQHGNCFLWALAACLCLQFISFGRVVEAQYLHDEMEFDYCSEGDLGPLNWGSIGPKGDKNWTICSKGTNQSPMILTPNLMVADSRLGVLNAVYRRKPIDAKISINAGTAVEVTLSNRTAIGNLTIDGEVYTPRQFHFHMGSEHKILGHSFPMELHLVHESPIHPGKRAVIAWLFVKGRHDDPFLAQFDDELPMPHHLKEVSIDAVKLPKLQKTYARYQGSLTTPPCTENVIWNIMLWDFPTISERQLKLFKAAMPKKNVRPSMPSNGRKFSVRL